MALGLRNCNTQLSLLPLIQGFDYLWYCVASYQVTSTCPMHPTSWAHQSWGGGVPAPWKRASLPVWWHVWWHASCYLSLLFFYLMGFLWGPKPASRASGLEAMARELSNGQETPWTLLSWSLIQWNSRPSFGDAEGVVNGQPSHRARLGSRPPWT